MKSENLQFQVGLERGNKKVGIQFMAVLYDKTEHLTYL